MVFSFEAGEYTFEAYDNAILSVHKDKINNLNPELN